MLIATRSNSEDVSNQIANSLSSITRNNSPVISRTSKTATSEYNVTNSPCHPREEQSSLLQNSSPSLCVDFGMSEYSGKSMDKINHSMSSVTNQRIDQKSNPDMILSIPENRSDTLIPTMVDPAIEDSTGRLNEKENYQMFTESDKHAQISDFNTSETNSSGYQVCKEPAPILKIPSPPSSSRESHYNKFDANHPSSNIFNDQGINPSEYQVCPMETFPEINLSSNEKFSFPDSSNFDSHENPKSNSNTTFENILTVEESPHFIDTQNYDNHSNFDSKMVYNFVKSSEISSDSNKQPSSPSSICSQNMTRVHDELLTKNPLLSHDSCESQKQTISSPRHSSNVFHFDTNSSLNSKRHFRDISNPQDNILFETNPKVETSSKIHCFNNLIRTQNSGQTEDTIQDSSDIFDHIMNKSPNNQDNATTSMKTDLYSNQDNIGDGLESINIEHMNDNSLSSIEINEKLSADLLNKETNLNLYTRNLTEYIANNQFNDVSDTNVRTITDSNRSNQDVSKNHHYSLGEGSQRSSPCRDSSITARIQTENLDIQNVCHRNSNAFECNNPTMNFSENDSNLTNVFVEKSVRNSQCDESDVISSLNVREKRKSVEEPPSKNENYTRSSDLDTSDLSNIILNNDIFALDTNNQSIQTIKEAYKIEEGNANLMIDNHVDGFAKQIFNPAESCLKHDVQQTDFNTNQQSVHMENRNSPNIESSAIKTSIDSNEVLKCGNEILDHPELDSMVDLGDHFHSKDVAMEINELFNTGSDFIPSINREQSVLPAMQDTLIRQEEKERVKSVGNMHKTDVSLSMAPFHSNVQSEQQNRTRVIPRKKKTVDSSKKQIKRKIHPSKDSSPPSAPKVSRDSISLGKLFERTDTVDTLLTNVNNELELNTGFQPKSNINMTNTTTNEFTFNRNQIINIKQTATCKESLELNNKELKSGTENVGTVLPSKKSRKRASLKQCSSEPGKKVKINENNVSNNNISNTNLLEENSSNPTNPCSYTEKPSGTSSSKSKKEQALNKLKLILITNKDVNLNNELISLNEEEILHDSNTVNESEEKSDIDNASKSFIDNTKLMDDEHETLMGSQMLENIEMFTNLTEYFNIDQSTELNQEINSDNIVHNSIASSETLIEVVDLESTSKTNNENQVSKGIDVSTIVKLSQKDKLVSNSDDRKCSKLNADNQNIKKKISRLKLLKNITMDKTLEVLDGSNKIRKLANKPKIIKQILGKNDKSSIIMSVLQPEEKRHGSDLEDTNNSTEGKTDITFTQSIINKSVIENVDKIHIQNKSSNDMKSIKKENDKVKTLKPKPIYLRNRSNSLDSNITTEPKRRSSLKSSITMTNDRVSHENFSSTLTLPQESILDKDVSKVKSSDIKKKSPAKAILPTVTNTLKNSSNKETKSSIAKTTVKPKTKKKATLTSKSSPVISDPDPKTQDKPKKSKTPRQPKVKDTIDKGTETCLPLTNDTTNINECLVEKSTSTSESCFNERVQGLERRDIECQTERRDMECQTDDQLENELFVINELPSPNTEYLMNESHIKDLPVSNEYLHETISERVSLFSKQFNDSSKTKLTFTSEKSLTKKADNAYFNNKGFTPSQHSDIDTSFTSSYSTWLTPAANLSSEHSRKSSEDIVNDNILDIQNYPGSIRGRNSFVDNLSIVKQDSRLEYKTHETGLNVQSFQNKKLGAHLNYLEDSLRATQNIKKKPKYIVMKIDGENKVYMLLDVEGDKPPEPVPTKTPDESRLGPGKSAIKELTSQIKAKNILKTTALGGNLESIKNKKENLNSRPVRNIFPNEECVKNICGDIQVIHSSETARSTEVTNKKLTINSKTVPHTKPVHLSMKSKIIKIVPMLPNKTPQGSKKNSLEELGVKKVTNKDNVLSSKQIRTDVVNPIKEINKTSQINKPSKEPNKSIQIKNVDGMKTIVINNNKTQKDSSQSLLETNKLILDILHKNKIKTIILGCKNKEILRRDLNNEETSGKTDNVWTSVENIKTKSNQDQQLVNDASKNLSNAVECKVVNDLQNKVQFSNKHTTIQRMNLQNHVVNTTSNNLSDQNDIQGNTESSTQISIRQIGENDKSVNEKFGGDQKKVEVRTRPGETLHICKDKGKKAGDKLENIAKSDQSDTETIQNETQLSFKNGVESVRVHNSSLPLPNGIPGVKSIPCGSIAKRKIRVLLPTDINGKVTDVREVQEQNPGSAPSENGNGSREDKDASELRNKEDKSPRKIKATVGPKENIEGVGIAVEKHQDIKSGTVGNSVRNHHEDKAVETLTKDAVDVLYDVIKVYRCKLCEFSSNERQTFADHLQSSHNKVS